MDGENTVRNRAISRNGSEIHRKTVYRMTMKEIDRWSKKGLVTDREYDIISTNLRRKYFDNAIESEKTLHTARKHMS